MIEACIVCRLGARVVPGPRNKTVYTRVCSPACRIRGLLLLAAEDMITREEADELNTLFSTDRTNPDKTGRVFA